MREPTITKKWAMPNSKTFNIKPISNLIDMYIDGLEVVVDPFANSSKKGTITNDIDDSQPTDYHMDATEFLRMLESESADVVLYDQPYSPRQVSECYKRVGKTVDMKTTQSSYWSEQKKEIARVLKHGGICITCAWNSGGIGEKYGFEQIEIMLVAHGGWHNDTIVTVERKL